jgi:hypothetical protein
MSPPVCHLVCCSQDIHLLRVSPTRAVVVIHDFQTHFNLRLCLQRDSIHPQQPLTHPRDNIFNNTHRKPPAQSTRRVAAKEVRSSTWTTSSLPFTNFVMLSSTSASGVGQRRCSMRISLFSFIKNRSLHCPTHTALRECEARLKLNVLGLQSSVRARLS